MREGQGQEQWAQTGLLASLIENTRRSLAYAFGGGRRPKLVSADAINPFAEKGRGARILVNDAESLAKMREAFTGSRE